MNSLADRHHTTPLLEQHVVKPVTCLTTLESRLQEPQTSLLMGTVYTGNTHNEALPTDEI